MYVHEGFALLPVCTLFLRADGVRTPISRPQRDSFGTKLPKGQAADRWVIQSLIHLYVFFTMILSVTYIKGIGII